MSLMANSMAEVLDPLDTEVVDITLTARDMYLVLSALYFDKANPPLDNLELIKYLEGRLLDNNLPADRQEFDSEYINDHSDNEQYKRIIFGTPEAP